MRPSTTLGAASMLSTCLAALIRTNGSLVFQDCPAALIPDETPLRCASFQVPMDWTGNSTDEHITIGVTKIPAKDPSNRIGPLFFNPGGPGLAVSTSLAEIASGLTPMHQDILERFDIIGVDVRGTGFSSPIKCSRELFNTPPVYFPSTPESYDAVAMRNQKFRQSCIDMTGSRLIDYMDTISIVHDLEAVRKALGGEKLTWLGQSWGTLLASQYAEFFAENVRGMVLDGVVSASQAPTAEFVPEAASMESTMNRFFDFCATTNATYCESLRENAKKPLPDLWKDVLAKAAQAPLPAPDCANGTLSCPTNNATLDSLLQGTTQYLYRGEPAYPDLAKGMRAVIVDNDASLLLANAINVPPGTSAYNASQFYASAAISCADSTNEQASPDLLNWWRQIVIRGMPYTLGVTPTVLFTYDCIGWPTKTRNPRYLIDIPDTLSSKALLVSNMWDPSTPTAWALEVQEEIGVNRAVLIGRNKPGHTCYFMPDAYDGETVAAINRYLLTLETPPQRTLYAD